MENTKDRFICSESWVEDVLKAKRVYCSVSVPTYSLQDLCTLGRFWYELSHSPLPWLRKMNHMLMIAPNTFKSGVGAGSFYKEENKNHRPSNSIFSMSCIKVLQVTPLPQEISLHFSAASFTFQLSQNIDSELLNSLIVTCVPSLPPLLLHR